MGSISCSVIGLCMQLDVQTQWCLPDGFTGTTMWEDPRLRPDIKARPLALDCLLAGGGAYVPDSGMSHGSDC